MSGMPVRWLDYMTGQVTAFRRRNQELDPAEPIIIHLYAHPRGEPDLRAVLDTLTGETHGYVSPVVPPGELRVSLDPIEDPRAVEVLR